VRRLSISVIARASAARWPERSSLARAFVSGEGRFGGVMGLAYNEGRGQGEGVRSGIHRVALAIKT
jgi:hypothetical protein